MYFCGRQRHSANRVTELFHSRSFAKRVAIVVLCVWASAHAPVRAQRYVAHPSGEVTFPGEPAMLMPSDVAVAADGTLCVADGVNDRVLVFADSGALVAEIRKVGGKPLSRPLGVDFDPQGRIWIADTGNSRVVACNADGSLVREIGLEQYAGSRPIDVCDVAMSRDGTRLWFADNDNHRVGSFDLRTGIVGFFGRAGESLGQFQYPFLMAVGASGDLFVTDVINGRVQILNTNGDAVGSIGSYGVEPGNLYRPKGVAIDADDNVWVADGRLGVVQIFRQSGGLLGVLRGANGEPLRLDGPSGIALDASGNLYVAELSANRVRKFRIVTQDGAVAIPRHATANIQPRACTACHIEWMQPLADGKATLLSDVPESSEHYPWVSRSDNCISCHDGSLVDSRRSIYSEHGRHSGARVPDDMVVSKRLPLVNDKVRCRTCHSAHTRGGAGASLKNAIFLRVETDANELCLSCHENKLERPTAGTHPMGPVDPEATNGAIAEAGLDPQHIRCASCHQAHSPADYLLRVQRDRPAEALCASCHTDKRHLEMTGHTEEVMRAAGIDALACGPCHRVHSTTGLVDDARRFASPGDSSATAVTDKFCVVCHDDGGAAPEPAIAMHPAVPLFNPMAPDTAGFLPLFDQAGEVSPTGKIGCRTCHIPHGRQLDAQSDDLPVAALSAAERSARRTALRSFAAPNVCTACHGRDGLRRFLYFHDVRRRGGDESMAGEPAAWRPRRR